VSLPFGRARVNFICRFFRATNTDAVVLGKRSSSWMPAAACDPMSRQSNTDPFVGGPFAKEHRSGIVSLK
jgi:hypothetical protein